MNLFFWTIPFFPLIGFLLLGLLGKKISPRAVSYTACGTVAVSFLMALSSLQSLLSLPEDSRRMTYRLFEWISVGGFHADCAFLLDALNIVMVLVITGIGLLIHIYSVGYMHGDGGYHRFFAYLNLFLFAMLVLVMADNYLLLFVGWEGVGLCSYLLIGFWFEKPAAASAGKKAFLVNRIGDAAFLLGVFLLFSQFGSIQFHTIQETITAHPERFPIEQAGSGVLTLAGLLLFVGAVGKSAQIPLYIWLPDAMEGPTPVSALIHAATMVTAGVYLVARSATLYHHAPFALEVIAVVGMATALFAATIGLVQRDIKRVLAYSTVSQLGYMFAALGVGAFTAGMFHLMTHAFFKALLFLGAGSVIHGMSGEQDLFKMGGLRKKMPWTFGVMLVAVLAIAGVPGLSGFFSKDEILWRLLSTGHIGLWLAGLAGALMTAFYTVRLLCLAFEPHLNGSEHAADHHAHESPAVMIAPLVVLALLSLCGGWVGLPSWLGVNHFEEFLAPLFPAHPVSMEEAAVPLGEIPATLASILLATGGICLALLFYRTRFFNLDHMTARFSAIHRILLNKYWVDEIYQAVLVKPFLWISRHILWHYWDQDIIDGIVNGTGRVLAATGKTLQQIQSGSVRHYAAWISFGTILLLAYLLILM